MQEPDEVKVLEGQDATHLPLDASWLFRHVRQNVALPTQVPQVESQAGKEVSLHIDGRLTTPTDRHS